MEQNIQKTILPNGLTVLTEQMDYLRSASVGIWVRCGSRHEPIEQSGISHFIEHMLFKGTEHRSTHDIAYETDLLGGNLDAFTSYECAGYSTKVLDEHLGRAFGLIADLVSAPLFDPTEITKERQVIIEEIKMIEDAPDELATEIFLKNFWPDHRLGTPISGTEESLNQITRDNLVTYWQQAYSPANLVVSAAGHVRHDDVVAMADTVFGHRVNSGHRPHDTQPRSHASIVIHPKDHLEQVQILLGAECPSLRSNDHFPLLMLNTILGGGVSSRLFLKIREEHGLAYAIDAAPLLFSDAGVFAVHAATSPEKVETLLDLTVYELQRLKAEPAPPEEFDRAKQLVKASLILSLDSCSARMSQMARHDIFFGRQLTVEEILRQVEAVTTEDIQRVANNVFQPDALALVVVGYVNSLRFERAPLACS
jgi:predicted Zn-dependent peptidase